MTDKTKCTHPSWKAIPNAKVQCELCGATGVELHYMKPDNSDEQIIPGHWQDKARNIVANVDYSNELEKGRMAIMLLRVLLTYRPKDN